MNISPLFLHTHTHTPAPILAVPYPNKELDKNIKYSNKTVCLIATAVTLKYGQGHWKWIEQVKLSE